VISFDVDSKIPTAVSITNCWGISWLLSRVMSLPPPTVWRQPETNLIVTSRDMLKAVGRVPDILERKFPSCIKGIFILRELRFLTLCSCELHFDRMTFLYESDAYFLEIHRMCKYDLLRQGFRQLSSDIHTYIPRPTDRQTDRQTDTTEIIYHAAWRVVNKYAFKCLLNSLLNLWAFGVVEFCFC